MGVYEGLLNGASIQEVVQMLIACSDLLNANEYPVFIELQPDELDQETADKRALRGALIEMINRINADPSVFDDAYVRPIIAAIKDVTDVRDARKLADALKNVKLPPEVFEPKPTRRAPGAAPVI